MRMNFGPDDEDAYFARRDELIAEFVAARPDVPDAGPEATLLLDWKWGYDDGDLATWTTRHLKVFLLDWCPRKVMMSARDAPPMFEALRAFLAFLATSGQLSRRSSSSGSLDAELRKNLTPFVKALGDSRKFGMGKSLLSAMGASPPGDNDGDDLDDLDGPDLSEPAAVKAMMDAFNSLPFEERGRILGLPVGPGSPLGAAMGPFGFGSRPPSPWRDLTDDLDFPPAPEIAKTELRSLAAALPILSQFDVMRSFVGTGKKLTAKGNLPPAVAVALVEALEEAFPEWRPPTPPLGPPEAKVRSADEFPKLQFLIRWAKAAGALRPSKGVLAATASWSKLKPEAAAKKALEALLAKGPLELRFVGNNWAGGALAEVIDIGAIHMLSALWASEEPLDYEDLLEGVIEACERLIEWNPHVPVDSRHSRIRSNLDLLWDLLGEAGVAERADAETTTTEWGTPHRSGGVVALTRLGYGLLADPLRAAGFDIPEVGLLAGGPLDAIVAMVGQWRAPTLTAEFQIWARRRSAEEVGDALCRLVDATSDPEVRLLAIKFAEALEEQQAEATVRTLLDTSARGHAIGWLTEHGCRDVPLDQEAIMRAGVEMFSMFTFSFASAPNIFAATPVDCFMPTPTTDTFTSAVS